MSLTESDKYPKRMVEGGTVIKTAKTIYNNTHLSKILDLKTQIGDYVYDEIRDNSQVGVILKLADSDFQFGGKHLYHLIANRLSTSMPHEMWVLADGRPIRFSLNEFKNITGLNCDPNDAAGEKNAMAYDEIAWSELGFGDIGPNWKEIFERLKQIRNDKIKKWSERSKRMMGLLVVLHAAILSLHLNTRIPLHLAKLVTVPEKFEAYPWGRASFEALFRSIPYAPTDKVFRLNLHGLVPALLIWAYEHLPYFAKASAIERPAEVPLLKWSARNIRLKEMEEYYADDKQETASSKIRVVHFSQVDQADFYPKWPGEPVQIDPKVDQMVKDMYADKLDESFWEGAGVTTVIAKSQSKTEESKKRKSKDIDTVIGSSEITDGDGNDTRVVAPDVNSDMQVILQDMKCSLEATISEGFQKVEGRIVNAEEKYIELMKQRAEDSKQVEERFRLLEDNVLSFNTCFNMLHERAVQLERQSQQQAAVNEIFLDKLAKLQGQRVEDFLSSPMDVPPEQSRSGKTRGKAKNAGNSDVVGAPKTRARRGSRNGGKKVEDPIKAVEADPESEVQEIIPNPNKKLKVPGPNHLIPPNLQPGWRATNTATKDSGISETRVVKTQKADLAGGEKSQDGAGLSYIENAEDDRTLADIVSNLTGVGRTSHVARQDPPDSDTAERYRARTPFRKADVAALGRLRATVRREVFYPERNKEIYDPERKYSPLAEFYLMAVLPKNEGPEPQFDWFNDLHMRAGMFLLIRRNFLHPSLYKKGRAAFMDVNLSACLHTHYYMFSKDREAFQFPEKYIAMCNGDYPPSYPTHKRWMDGVDIVYAAQNVKLHWVALEISLVDRWISVYDPDPTCTETIPLKDCIRPLAEMLPYLLRAITPEESRGEVNLNPFEIERVEGTPVQKVSGECGIYTLKFIECLALGSDISLLNHFPAQDMKITFAVDVHEELKTNEIVNFNDLILRCTGTDSVGLKKSAQPFLRGK